MAKTNLPVIDVQGKQVAELEAPAAMFGIEPNESVVHFVCEGQRFRFYKKTACVKTRSAVQGTTKKRGKQKGSGSARQGSGRAPHFVGGGIAFGPAAIKRDFKINKKTRDLAMASVLSDRAKSGQVRVLRANLDAPKTKTFSNLLGKLNLKTARVAFLVDSASDKILLKSVANIKNADVLKNEKWTPLDLVKSDSVIFSEAAFNKLMKQSG